MSRQLSKEEIAVSICEGKYIGEMDGKPLPGDFFDITDSACPGWWRGHDYASKKFEEKITKLERSLKTEQDYALTLLKRLENL